MPKNQSPSGLLRGIAVLFMAVTVLFTLMGAIGTTCVAFGAENYESMVGLVPYKPLYKVLVFASLAAGIWGVVINIKLIRGGAKIYRNAVIMLLIGTLTSGIQTFVSKAVRGSAAPVNVRFFITTFTLIVFLLFHLPSIWKRMQSKKSTTKESDTISSGTALTTCGIITLTTYYWTRSTHLTEWINVIHLPIMLSGWAMTCAGVATLSYKRVFLKKHKNRVPAPVASFMPFRILNRNKS